MGSFGRFSKVLSQYFRTVKYLWWHQVLGRVWHRLFRPRLWSAPLPRKALCKGSLSETRPRVRSMTGPDSLVFLNLRAHVGSLSDWNDPTQDKLWPYNFTTLSSKLYDKRPKRIIGFQESRSYLDASGCVPDAAEEGLRPTEPNTSPYCDGPGP